MNSIKWPKAYLPGYTDNFVSNEIIIPDLDAKTVWQYLTDTKHWPTYYSNVSDIVLLAETAETVLKNGTAFDFTTFVYRVNAKVVEFEAPDKGTPGRIAWHGLIDGNEDEILNVHHAWIIEDLPGNRVRILTQETQNGIPAKEMAQTVPNPMLNAHQEWITGLANIALKTTKHS